MGNPIWGIDMTDERSPCCGAEYPYVFHWGNNSKRAKLKGRKFRVLARGGFNSAKVEFENGEIEIISRNAIRKCHKPLEAEKPKGKEG